jgi:(p)ppGpp synthase/HD superfamily hydrolase
MHPSDRFSLRFDRALTLASLVHDGVNRKGTVVPYITHPVHVARLLDQHGFSEDVVLAGLLHDVLEDAKFGDTLLQIKLSHAFSDFAETQPSEPAFRAATEKFIETHFGRTVLQLVCSVTEVKGDDGGERDWRLRKQEQLEHIPKMTREQAALKAADALHNCRASLRDVQRDGLKMFRRFKCRVEDTLWYLAESNKALGRSKLKGSALQRELKAAASQFVKEVNRLRNGRTSRRSAA